MKIQREVDEGETECLSLTFNKELNYSPKVRSEMLYQKANSFFVFISYSYTLALVTFKVLLK